VTLDEYYKHYLTLHQHHMCRRMHFIGQIVTLLFTYFIIVNGLWLLVPVIPFIVYPFAWSGHYFFEKNKPAAFTDPVKAKISDWIMFKDILIGRLSV